MQKNLLANYLNDFRQKLIKNLDFDFNQEEDLFNLFRQKQDDLDQDYLLKELSLSLKNLQNFDQKSDLEPALLSFLYLGVLLGLCQLFNFIDQDKAEQIFDLLKKFKFKKFYLQRSYDHLGSLVNSFWHQASLRLT